MQEHLSEMVVYDKGQYCKGDTRLISSATIFPNSRAQLGAISGHRASAMNYERKVDTCPVVDTIADEGMPTEEKAGNHKWQGLRRNE